MKTPFLYEKMIVDLIDEWERASQEPTGEQSSAKREAFRKALDRTFSLPDFHPLAEAADGNWNEFSTYIENGGAISDLGRAWLASALRGEEPKGKRGTKRTMEQIMSDLDAAFAVADLMIEEGLTKNAAIQRHHGKKENITLNDETFKSSVKRAEKELNCSMNELVKVRRNGHQA